MADREFDGGAVLETAQRWLRKNSDSFTRRHRDELAQDAVAAAWRAHGSLRDPERLTAFVRTIVQRVRYHALRRHYRARAMQLDVDPQLIDQMQFGERAEERSYRVGGELVDSAWLLRELDAAVARLDETNRGLLRSFYAGSTCREIGGRYGLSEGCVKQRLFRARARVRLDLESRARCAGLAHVPVAEREAVR